MTNIIMICKDRPRLTKQTLLMLYYNTPRWEYNLTVVNDYSQLETERILEYYDQDNAWSSELTVPEKSISGCVGALKNWGAQVSAEVFGRGDFLCFIDNDIAFMTGWLGTMIKRTKGAEDVWPGRVILGGYQHPYHQPCGGAYGLSIYEDMKIVVTDAVAGYLHFMSCSTWDKFGPYDATAKGVCQSEDHAICRRVVEAGGLVGYVHPPVIANCGLTNSEGKPAIGGEAFPRIPGLIYE